MVVLPGTPLRSEAAPRWDVGRVLRALRSTGLKVRRDVAVRQPFLKVSGVVLVVGKGEAEIQTYVYRDDRARRADTDVLDAERAAPPTFSPAWLMKPSLVADNNVALIVLTDDETLRSRITEAVRGKAGALPARSHRRSVARRRAQRLQTAVEERVGVRESAAGGEARSQDVGSRFDLLDHVLATA